MENITANLSGKPRSETRNGREHLVVPATLIVPGVLNGSDGPLNYPLDEIQRSADAWNGMPLVVGHPMQNGSPVSARNPTVLERSQVGEVFNVGSKDKLTAEAWFDVEKTERVDSRILPALRAGKPIELSTGLGVDRDDVSGTTTNGTTYVSSVKNFKPDHLAILPDEIGACSVHDGCGILVNSEARLVGFTDFAGDHQHVATVGESGKGITNRVKGHVHFVNKFTLSVADDHIHPLQRKLLIDSGVRNLKNKGESEMDEAQKKAAIDGLIANVCCWEEKDREMLNSQTDEHLGVLVANGAEVQANEEKHELVVNALKETHTLDEKSGKWVLNDEYKKPKGKVKKVEDTTTTNETPKQLTEEEFAAMAPQSVQNKLAFADQEMQRQKDVLINQLTADVTDAAKPAQIARLQNRSLVELQGDVALRPVQPVSAPVANWAGAAGGSPTPVVENQYNDFQDFGIPGQGGYLEEESKEAVGA